MKNNSYTPYTKERIQTKLMDLFGLSKPLNVEITPRLVELLDLTLPSTSSNLKTKENLKEAILAYLVSTRTKNPEYIMDWLRRKKL